MRVSRNDRQNCINLKLDVPTDLSLYLWIIIDYRGKMAAAL